MEAVLLQVSLHVFINAKITTEMNDISMDKKGPGPASVCIMQSESLPACLTAALIGHHFMEISSSDALSANS